ncbi:protein kinase-like protein [Thermococcus cleftensis]|uniref:Protein kinase-like protein n=1 Tax=Thermococcus cleftensis (strain DSM 27260 / KACC 17922 / CL1) TaxID=163003 RepID=I3ZUI8_THECF|nr:serine/threonine protein kinase [Thermococcus cleftensis]AFL95372.1 protein kinase-like protein [Thermococcus cleftensis]
MFDHLISKAQLERFYSRLKSLGFEETQPYAKGTTSLIFRARLDEKNVIIKLQRPDSPRQNFEREARIIKTIEPFGVTPPLVAYGLFEGLEYLIREFADGEIIFHADLEKRHLFEIAEKAALLDRLGIDHGQIQGGKHIIIGERVYLIDFEKAGWRKPKNLTSAMAMLFLSDNYISRRVRRRFGIGEDFLGEMREAVREYKRTGKLSGLLRLLSRL